MFWIIAFAIAVVAALIISMPLLFGQRRDGLSLSNDAEVYRDQLQELGRDQQSGLIGSAEATQAKAEIARRLIAVSERSAPSESGLGRSATIVLVVFLCLVMPAGGALLYGRMGSPDEPDQPLAQRMNSPRPDINILIAKTEAHLAAKPDDGKGWELLAPIYMRQMRADDAVNAYRNAIRILGDDAMRYGSLAEALAAKAGGRVDKEALEAFRKALQLDPSDPRARFYVALADAQSGKLDEAQAAFEALAKDSPADAPWQGIIKDQIALIQSARNGPSTTLGNPDAADIEAASGLNEADRAQMIRTMVETLDERLTAEPANFEGWMRLIRSYVVLKQPDQAEEAVRRGLKAFPAESENGRAILALAKDLGLKLDETVNP